MAALDKPLDYDVINIGRGEPVRLGDADRYLPANYKHFQYYLNIF